MSDVGSAVPEEDVDPGDPLVRVDNEGFRLTVTVGQALDLIDVEDGIGFQEWNAVLDIGVSLVGLGPDELVSVDHRRAAFAFADVSSQRQRLPEGHPGGPGVAPVDGLTPEQDDVDAVVWRPVVAERSAHGG